LRPKDINQDIVCDSKLGILRRSSSDRLRMTVVLLNVPKGLMVGYGNVRLNANLHDPYEGLLNFL
jgi:hypothetical protein